MGIYVPATGRRRQEHLPTGRRGYGVLTILRVASTVYISCGFALAFTLLEAYYIQYTCNCIYTGYSNTGMTHSSQSYDPAQCIAHQDLRPSYGASKIEF
jgi:hypothetical protein